MSNESAINRFLSRALSSIAGFCVRRGVKFQQFQDIAKKSFIDAARDEIESRGDKLNTSRVSVITGLQRKDINHLLSEDKGKNEEVGLATKTIGHWRLDPRFTTKKGQPRVLTYGGLNSEFAELVQSVSTDVNPASILYELERTGAVSKSARGIQLIRETYDPSKSLDEGLSLLSSDMNDLLYSVEDNLFCDHDTPNLHIKTYYDNICQDSLPEIKLWLLKLGTSFHAKARKYLAQHDKDLNPKLVGKKGGGKISFATFSYTPEEKPDEEDEKVA